MRMYLNTQWSKPVNSKDMASLLGPRGIRHLKGITFSTETNSTLMKYLLDM